MWVHGRLLSRSLSSVEHGLTVSVTMWRYSLNCHCSSKDFFSLAGVLTDQNTDPSQQLFPTLLFTFYFWAYVGYSNFA